MALIDWESFRTQYLMIYSAIYMLRNVGVIDTAVSWIGSSLVLSTLAWVSTKYVRKQFMNREFLASDKKAVLITGSDNGIGQDLAIKLNESGYRVYATVMNETAPTVERLMNGSRFQSQMIVKKMDVTNETEVNSVAKEVTDELAKNGEQLWAVINAAEVQEFGHFDWSRFEMYEKIFDVNTFGMVRVVRAFLPLLRQSKGRIVNLESVAGRLTLPKLTAYCMSKHANLSFADALRREMNDWDIKVSTVELAFDRRAGHLLTMEKFVKSVNRQWAITPEHIQQLYGNQYLQHIKHENLSQIFVNDLAQVIDDTMDAVRGQEPAIRYTPYTSLKAKLWSNLAQIVPIEWLDKYYYTMEKESPKPIKPTDPNTPSDTDNKPSESAQPVSPTPGPDASKPKSA